jgi:hypothetical protein
LRRRARGAGWLAVALATAWALGSLAASWSAGGDAQDGADQAPPTAQELAAELTRERAVWRAREDELLARIGVLQRELERQGALREAREREWLEFTRALAVLPVPVQLPPAPAFLPKDVEEELPGPDAAALAAAERRSGRLLRDLNALLTAEQVLALDVLSVGHVHAHATGPLVVRLVDDLGRPSGVLMADRLRLECSRAGRSVTLVFENGYESHGGVAVPFGAPTEPGGERGGVRRLHLPMVDPQPWLEAFPELFDPAQVEVLHDDGLWNLVDVRASVNDLLRRAGSDGFWRLRGLGGVVRGVLRDVQLAEVDADGRVVRRLFADALSIEPHGAGVVLTLTGGAQVRGGSTAPFLEGRYRVIRPRASVDAWIEAGLPGLAPPPPARPGG